MVQGSDACGSDRGVRRARGATGSGRARSRAGRGRGACERRAGRHQLRRHPPAGELLPGQVRAAADPGRRGGRPDAGRAPGGRAAPQRRVRRVRRGPAGDDLSAARPPRRRRRTGAARPGAHGLAPLQDQRQAGGGGERRGRLGRWRGGLACGAARQAVRRRPRARHGQQPGEARACARAGSRRGDRHARGGPDRRDPGGQRGAAGRRGARDVRGQGVRRLPRGARALRPPGDLRDRRPRAEHRAVRRADAEEPRRDRLLAHALPGPTGDDGGAAPRPLRARRPGRAPPADGRHLPAVRGAPRPRGSPGPQDEREAPPRSLRMTAFAELGLAPDLLDALRHLGYERPTPIQEQAIPALLEGRDVIGQAQTGTGKTAAFGLPMLQFVDPEDPDVQALVLTPTRELCIQVTQALRAYGRRRGVEVVAVFGGAPIRDQAARLGRGAQVVVGTVGRVLDMVGRHHLFLDQARYVVLDEADEMLDLGFLEDVETILSRCPQGRQTSLFSATIPPPIRALAEKRMYDPVTIKVRAATLTIDTVDHYYVEVPDREKPGALARVLKAERPEQAIVFVRTKIGVDRLARRLGDDGIRVKTLHGDMPQGQRDGVMIAFKGGRERLLVATDVAARGLDITGVSHVVNYDIPNSPDIYVHRIGRTGRAGDTGRAITLVNPRQRRELAAIERHAKTEIEEWSANGGAPRERRGEREARRPRHTKPHEREERRAKLLLGAGRRDGFEPADVVGAIVDHSHLEGEDIHNVRVLERFSFVEVPAERAGEVVDKVSGRWVRGRELRLEVTTR